MTIFAKVIKDRPGRSGDFQAGLKVKFCYVTGDAGAMRYCGSGTHRETEQAGVSYPTASRVRPTGVSGKYRILLAGQLSYL